MAAANEGGSDAKPTTSSGGVGGGAEKKSTGFETKDEVDKFNQHPAVPIFSKYVIDDLLLKTFDWFPKATTTRAPSGGPPPPSPPILNILDYGCGNGINLFKLARLGHAVTGVDVSKAMIDHVFSKIKDEMKTADETNASNDTSGGGGTSASTSPAGGTAKTYQPTLIHLDDDGDSNTGVVEMFAEATNSTFDLVLISLVLHHASEPLAIVRNLCKTLKDEDVTSSDPSGTGGGGRFLIIEFDNTERTKKSISSLMDMGTKNKDTDSKDAAGGGGSSVEGSHHQHDHAHDHDKEKKDAMDVDGETKEADEPNKRMKHDHDGDHGHHHGHGHGPDHYLDREDVAKAMTESGLEIVENKKFTLEIKAPDTVMDCYYVLGQKKVL